MLNIITGHICSGKTTLVNSRAACGDVIIDLDAMALAMTPQATPHHVYPPHAREIARFAWWTAVEAAVRMHRKHKFTAWIIHAYPTAGDLSAYRTWRATIIALDTDPQLCLARAREQRPTWVVAELEKRLRE